MVDPAWWCARADFAPLAVVIVLLSSFVSQAASLSGETPATAVGQADAAASADTASATDSTNGDSRLRSAYLMRKVNRYADDRATASAQLQRHFAAVLARLADDSDQSLSIALERLEAHRGEKWPAAERQAWRERLAANRAANMATLKQYQLDGTFPINELFADPMPIFVDHHDTACAVGHLMRRTGWTDAVESVASESNFVFIDDVTDGPVLEWILQSGLTREEAAMIQPSYRCHDPLTVATVPFTSGSLTFTYAPADGNLSMNIGDGSVTALEVKSAGGLFDPEKANPATFSGILDTIDENKLFMQRGDGLAKALSFGTILPRQMAANAIIADLSVDGVINLAGCDRLYVFPQSGIVTWDEGEVILGTEDFTPKPGVQLGFRQLRFAWLGGVDLTGANFQASNLTRSRLTGSILTDVNFVKSDLSGAYFDTATLTGTRLLESNLTDAVLFSANMEGADFSGADLTRARPFNATLKSANLSDANLTAAAFFQTEMASANLSGASLANADFSFARLLGTAVFSAETTYNQWTKFPEGFDPVVFGLTRVTSQPGDLDGMEGLAASDVDLLARRLRNQLFMSWQYEMFDLNDDAVIDATDLDTWVHDLKGTWFGDANLDGQFDSTDLIDALAAGEYEDDVTQNSTWATGDWDADGDFTSTDLIVALADGGYEQGPRPPIAQLVPEPTSIRWLLAVLWVSAGLFARRERCYCGKPVERRQR